MKKLISSLFCVVAITVMAVSFTSCKDEPSNGLKGNWYLSAKQSSDGGATFYYAYYFVNDNTVEYYPYVCDRAYWDSNSEPLTGKMKGYYTFRGEIRTYTYQASENKVIIMMQGVILTIDGDRLIQDGGITYTKKK